MEYYAIINGHQVGPMPKEQLMAAGLTPETHVWAPGMPNHWVEASTVPELNELLVLNDNESAFGTYARQEESRQPQQSSGYPQQGYPTRPIYPNPQKPFGYPGRPAYEQPSAPMNMTHTNWMPWAIAGTVLGLCSCVGLICGIIAMIYASKANNAYMVGQEYQGDQANSTAKVMAIISMILGGLSIIGGIISSVFNLWSGILSAV